MTRPSLRLLELFFYFSLIKTILVAHGFSTYLTYELLASQFDGENLLCQSESEVRGKPQLTSVYDMRRQTRQCRGKVCTLLKAEAYDVDGEKDSAKDEKVDMKKIELSLDSITDMIDVTFVKGCMDLASGYVDVLKLMIVATKAAYSMGITFEELLRNLQDKTSDFSPAANRPLMKEEIDLRSYWVGVIYLTLLKLSYRDQERESKNICDGIDQAFKEKYDGIIDTIIDAGDGISTSHITVDQFLHLIDTKADPVQRAISLQCIRVILLTLLVIEEENKCTPSTPRPPIPGAN